MTLMFLNVLLCDYSKEKAARHENHVLERYGISWGNVIELTKASEAILPSQNSRQPITT